MGSTVRIVTMPGAMKVMKLALKRVMKSAPKAKAKAKAKGKASPSPVSGASQQKGKGKEAKAQTKAAPLTAGNLKFHDDQVRLAVVDLQKGSLDINGVLEKLNAGQKQVLWKRRCEQFC